MRDIDGQVLRPGERVRAVGLKVPQSMRCKVYQVKGAVVWPDGLIERAVLKQQLRDVGLQIEDLVDLHGEGWMIAAQLQVIKNQFIAAEKPFQELMRDLQY